MATGTGTVVLTAATAIKLMRNPQRDHSSWVTVTNTGTAALFLGGNAVTATSGAGYSMTAGSSITLQIAPQDDLWAFSALAGSCLVLTSP